MGSVHGQKFLVSVRLAQKLRPQVERNVGLAANQHDKELSKLEGKPAGLNVTRLTNVMVVLVDFSGMMPMLKKLGRRIELEVAMRNRLLDLMPDAVRRELRIAGGEFSLTAGEAIPPESLEGSFVFVVDEGVASKFLRSEEGGYSEIGMVGCEGMFPVCGLLNVPAAPHVVISQIGELKGRRIRSREFHSIVQESPEARLLVRKYTFAFMTQIASNILSTEQDMVPTRLARWLLMCHDRIEGDEISITHETLAQMAFAQRPTVTQMLNQMQEDGRIALARGKIRVLDRNALLKQASGAYGLSERYWRDHIGPAKMDGTNGARAAA